MPTIKSLKIALETLELLEMDVKDVRILMNRSGARVGLDDRDVKRTLRRRDHLHAGLRQGHPDLGQPRPAGGHRRPARVARSFYDMARSLDSVVGSLR